VARSKLTTRERTKARPLDMPIKVTIRNVIGCRACASHQKCAEKKHYQKPKFGEPLGRLNERGKAGEKGEPYSYRTVDPGKPCIRTPSSRQPTVNPIANMNIAEVRTVQSSHHVLQFCVTKIPKFATYYTNKTSDVTGFRNYAND
jgi:hypothetical protein